MRAKIISAAVLVIALIGAAYWYWSGQKSALQTDSDDPNAPFILVDAADRGLDGAPALALTFSLPLDAKQGYDKYVQVFEMPDRKSVV